MEIFTARHVLPVARPAIEDGAVAVREGRIVAVGPRAAVLGSADARARIHDLGDAAVFPGLVNAHLHLELSWLAGSDLPSGDYVAWISALVARRAGPVPPDARDIAARALAAIVARGTVAVGDVANELWTVPVLARSPIHAVVFHEIYDLGAADAETILRETTRRLDEAAADAAAADPDVAAAASRVRIAVAPHAPHTTSVALLRALAGRSAATGDPLSIHVAESREEVELLRHGTGALRALLRSRGACGDDWEPPRRSPIDHLKRCGALGPRTLAVHAVHLDGTDVRTLQASGASVVTCPRSNARLGVGRAPVPALLRAGVAVALGTDSLASAPDLDLLSEMAALGDAYPEITPATILRMATLHGARALGLADHLGSIEVGKLPALVVLPLGPGDDRPLDRLCTRPATVYRLDDAARALAGAR
jgi:aminodeoxyfutalosine deaminase